MNIETHSILRYRNNNISILHNHIKPTSKQFSSSSPHSPPCFLIHLVKNVRLSITQAPRPAYAYAGTRQMPKVPRKRPLFVRVQGQPTGPPLHQASLALAAACQPETAANARKRRAESIAKKAGRAPFPCVPFLSTNRSVPCRVGAADAELARIEAERERERERRAKDDEPHASDRARGRARSVSSESVSSYSSRSRSPPQKPSSSPPSPHHQRQNLQATVTDQAQPRERGRQRSRSASSQSTSRYSSRSRSRSPSPLLQNKGKRPAVVDRSPLSAARHHYDRSRSRSPRPSLSPVPSRQSRVQRNPSPGDRHHRLYPNKRSHRHPSQSRREQGDDGPPPRRPRYSPSPSPERRPSQYRDDRGDRNRDRDRGREYGKHSGNRYRDYQQGGRQIHDSWQGRDRNRFISGTRPDEPRHGRDSRGAEPVPPPRREPTPEPGPPRERSLSPFSKRVAMTRALNNERRC